jgi:hypothetical protein
MTRNTLCIPLPIHCHKAQLWLVYASKYCYVISGYSYAYTFDCRVCTNWTPNCKWPVGVCFVYFLRKVAQRKGTVPFLSKSTLFSSVENSISFSTSQEISNILWNPRDHYRVQNSPPLAPILRQEESSLLPRVSFTVCNCVPTGEWREDRLYGRSYCDSEISLSSIRQFTLRYHKHHYTVFYVAYGNTPYLYTVYEALLKLHGSVKEEE